MLRYEYEDDGKRIVFVKPSEVVSIERSQAFKNIDFSFVTLSNNVKVVIPKSPDAFAAEVEKHLEGNPVRKATCSGDTEMKKLLTPRSLDRILDYPRGRSVKLARVDQIPHIVLPDGEIRFDPHDIQDWVKRCRRPIEKGSHDAPPHPNRGDDVLCRSETGSP